MGITDCGIDLAQDCILSSCETIIIAEEFLNDYWARESSELIALLGSGPDGLWICPQLIPPFGGSIPPAPANHSIIIYPQSSLFC
jgi:hypothetical protein